jgi:hypothetical protein
LRVSAAGAFAQAQPAVVGEPLSALGGSLRLESPAGGGTRLTVRIPR